MKILNATIILSLSVCAAFGADYHVSPTGNDQSNGTEANPFASLDRARKAARVHAGSESVTVWLHEGIHYLPETLKLTHEDSGSEEHPVTYRGTGSGAIISGGRLLDLKWTPHQDGILLATTPDGIEFDQLFVDGQRQHMARYPNYNAVTRPFNGFAADAFSVKRAENWKAPQGGFIHAMHRAHWGGYHYRITGKKENGEVEYEGGWQNNRQMGMHDQHRFVENIFEELDTEGEWFHDADSNTLYYYPREKTELQKAQIEVVRLNQLIQFDGSREKPVRHIKLKNLEFRHAARTFMENREPLLRSDWTVHRGGALLVHGAENCTIDRCVFDQLGGNAVFVNNYNRNIEVTGCHIHDAGGNGISFVGNPDSVRDPLFQYNERQSLDEIDLTQGPRSVDYPSKCLVENCLIERTGRVEKQTAGVQISMASHITVRHCSVCEVPRAGINISEGTFGGHLIEYCDVFDTVLETGDHGSFNSWGRDRFWGLKDAPEDQLPDLARLDMVAPNIIRNSRWRCDHGWDIDLDDGSSNYLVYNNLMLSGGLKFREGFHRVAKNNIMVGNSFHPHVWYKNSGDVFRNNIVFTPYRPIRVPVPWGSEVDKNLLHERGAKNSKAAKVLAEQSGRDEHSIVADAMFVNPQAGNFQVKEGSPALGLGFKNFPMDRFGVQIPDLKQLARTPDISDVRKVSSPESGGETASKPMEHVWNGATIRDLTGEEFSTFGVSKETGGINLSKVPRDSTAGQFGFERNDLIQKVNGRAVKSVAELRAAENDLAGKSMRVVIVRQQKERTLEVPTYAYVVLNQSEAASFEKLKIPIERGIEFDSIATRPKTNNDPLSILNDRQLKEGYGPVFKNGHSGGIYKVSLGKMRSIKSIATVTFNQNGNRGHQRFVVFGSIALEDPGWDTSDQSLYKPICEVDSIGTKSTEFQATEIRSSDASLGQYRWLVWVVYPVTNQAENSAFQELVVTETER